MAIPGNRIGLDDRPSAQQDSAWPSAGGLRQPRRTMLTAFGALLAAGWAQANRSATAARPVRRPIKWLAFYGQLADERILARYDIVILDPDYKGSVAAIRGGGARVAGYLSLGEIRASSPFFGQVNQAALLEENPDWPGTFRVDVRHPSWRALVLDQMIPDIRARDFVGLLYDTLDTPPYLEQRDPVGRRGMRQAAINLIRAIREAYPEMLLIMNRGYALLPDVADSVDAVMAESLLTRHDALARGGYRWNEASEVAIQMSLLAPAMSRRPPLPVLSLDYWSPDDSATISEIYAREWRQGCHPYVSTPMLDQIVTAPA
jgi:uncharacterized protein (TIGR01370 family)